MPEEKRPSPWIETYHSSLFKLLGIYEEWSRSYGINLYEYVILSYIYDHQERCSHKDIIRERLMPARLVDSVLKQFEQWGMIEFYVNTEDRRGKIIRLTEIGVESAQKVILGGREMEKEARSRFGLERFDQFQKLIEDFLKALRISLDDVKI